MNPLHLRSLVVLPVLSQMAAAHERSGLASDAAVQLMLGTAWQESRGEHLTQLGGGPARGLWQVEKATARWLDQRLKAKRFNGLRAMREEMTALAGAAAHDAMCWDLRLACFYGRLRFWVVPEPLPEPATAAALGDYWKRHYNTEAGAGTAEQWARSHRAYQAAARRATA